MSMSVRITGLTETQKNLRLLPRKVSRQAALKALRAAGKPILTQARNNAPVRSGALKKGIVLRVVPVSKTGPGVHGVTIGLKSGVYYGRFVEFGTVKQSAQPFLGPAFNQHKSQVVPTIGVVLFAFVRSSVGT